MHVAHSKFDASRPPKEKIALRQVNEWAKANHPVYSSVDFAPEDIE
jgi:hypothetical protein